MEKKLIPLAPLHNPANVLELKFVNRINAKCSKCCNFDTAFHQTMPEENFYMQFLMETIQNII